MQFFFSIKRIYGFYNKVFGQRLLPRRRCDERVAREGMVYIDGGIYAPTHAQLLHTTPFFAIYTAHHYTTILLHAQRYTATKWVRERELDSCVRTSAHTTLLVIRYRTQLSKWARVARAIDTLYYVYWSLARRGSSVSLSFGVCVCVLYTCNIRVFCRLYMHYLSLSVYRRAPRLAFTCM